eukprot:882430_1
MIRVLITIPAKAYQFEYELLQSLIQDVQQSNDRFTSIETQLDMKVMDHSQISSHAHSRANVQPHFSIIISSSARATSCANDEIHTPMFGVVLKDILGNSLIIRKKHKRLFARVMGLPCNSIDFAHLKL